MSGASKHSPGGEPTGGERSRTTEKRAASAARPQNGTARAEELGSSGTRSGGGLPKPLRDTEAFREFKQAVTFLRDAYPTKALPHLRRAVELEKHNPYYQSYLGVALAYAERRWAEAEQLCEAALKLRRNEPQLYLNLAEVYVAAGRREDAAEIIHMGLKYARRDFRLNLALSRLELRRPPVLRFLSRKHFLNRKLGMWRHRARKYFAAC